MGIASDRIEIAIAHDHAMIRSGLRRVLDTETDLSVVADAVNIDGALDQTLDPARGLDRLRRRRRARR